MITELLPLFFIDDRIFFQTFVPYKNLGELLVNNSSPRKKAGNHQPIIRSLRKFGQIIFEYQSLFCLIAFTSASTMRRFLEEKSFINETISINSEK